MFDKKKNAAESYGVIGLGRFGTALVKTLAAAGKEVIAVDKDEAKVKAVRGYTDYAFVIDELDETSLKETGMQNCGTVTICIGEQIDISILTTMLVTKLGVPHVISKAASEVHGEVLKRLGAEVVYPIAFRDGTVYAVIYDNSDSRLYDVTWVVSLLLGCAVLALTLLAYNRRVARKVVAISHEVQSIGEGNLYLQLEPKGSDELAQLTASVEQMRLSLLRKTSEEQRALQQNSDLITAMSHDIRNPLTALLGYLDLAKTGQYRTQEELQSYLDAAYGKAEQLKRLTDELFRYSLLFGCKELPLQLERYDASILLGQLLGESRAQLQQQGFTVQLLLPQQDVQIEADVTYLKRVFDNLFDNIRKYADPARPVAIAALLKDGALHVCLSNSVNPGAGRIESNKIGLRTCAKIMAQMSGSFKRYTESGKFTAEVILPILPAGDPDGSS